MMPWDFAGLDAVNKAALIGCIKVRIEAERKQQVKMKRK
jgi:hypothetical protein